MFTALFNTLLNLKRYYTTPYRAWLGNKLIVVISEPEDLEIVLSKCIQKETTLAKLLSPIIGNGLITAIRKFLYLIINSFSITF